MTRAPLAQILAPNALVIIVLILVVSCGTPACPVCPEGTLQPPLQLTPGTATNTPPLSPIPSGSPTPPQVTTYVVQRGDNLWDIANRFGTTVEAIMELNRLSSTLIYSGTELRIPSGESSAPTLMITPTPTLSETATPRPSEATPRPSTATPPPSTATPGTSPTVPHKPGEVYVGMAADDVIILWGEPVRTRIVGRDEEGAIVEWVYSEARLIMKRWEMDGVLCYRVAEIRPR